jgi:riboflavin-specific deaminase-like protein
VTGTSPARVVLDSLARVPPTARLFAADGARRIVVCGAEAPAQRTAALEALGAEVLRCATAQPTPAEYLPRLRAAGLRTVLVEGGAQVHANLIAQGAANELFLYIAGRMIGDAAAPGWCGALGITRLDAAPCVRLDVPRSIGEDVLVHGWFD